VHILVEFIQRIHFVPILAIFLDKLTISFIESLRVEETLDGIHRMLHSNAVNTKPFNFLLHAPGRKIRRRTRMPDHVAKFIRILAGPTIFSITGFNQQISPSLTSTTDSIISGLYTLVSLTISEMSAIAPGPIQKSNGV
jgi:hypothetical protein